MKMFDTLDLLSTTKSFPTNAPGRDPADLFQTLNGVIASSAATGVTLAPAATTLLQIGEQLAQQDSETSGEKKNDKKKKGKTKKINKSNLSDKVIKAFYFNFVLVIRMLIEDERKKGRVRTVRAKEYIEFNGLTGILIVNFMDQSGVKYTYNTEDEIVRTNRPGKIKGVLEEIQGFIEVIKPDGTVVYIFGR